MACLGHIHARTHMCTCTVTADTIMCIVHCIRALLNSRSVQYDDNHKTCFLQSYMCTSKDICIDIHTLYHAYTHTHTHTHRQVILLPLIHSLWDIHVRVPMHTHTHKRLFIQICIHVYVHTHAKLGIHISLGSTCTHTYPQLHTHTDHWHTRYLATCGRESL